VYSVCASVVVQLKAVVVSVPLVLLSGVVLLMMMMNIIINIYIYNNIIIIIITTMFVCIYSAEGCRGVCSIGSALRCHLVHRRRLLLASQPIVRAVHLTFVINSLLT